MIAVGIILHIVFLIVAALGVIGWFKNIYEIVLLFMNEAYTLELVGRIIGIPVMLLGAIIGWV
ncbi:hypothetical protein [Maritalea mediterranea]|uniref:Uncharacterized protein n=1 Tax=Maritalea mediterranea TaxID=2909667 RepID=A0ABS9EEG0_9HYPH|nr:hypothetical protein [Maritalea mediterranea]MCF4099798.1 hypothetical protein [Maritalea mediterranea]